MPWGFTRLPEGSLAQQRLRTPIGQGETGSVRAGRTKVKEQGGVRGLGFGSGTDIVGDGKEMPGQTRVPSNLRGAEEQTARKGTARGSPKGKAPGGHFLKL